VKVLQVPIETAIKVHSQIPEFRETPPEKKYFEGRYDGRDHLILCAFDQKDHAAGYMIAYDKFGDGSFYCWMAGVIPQFRKCGALTAMMNYLFAWAKERGYKKIKIKTRNDKRDMLVFLVKNGFNFTAVVQHEKIADNRIELEQEILTKSIIIFGERGSGKTTFSEIVAKETGRKYINVYGPNELAPKGPTVFCYRNPNTIMPSDLAKIINTNDFIIVYWAFGTLDTAKLFQYHKAQKTENLIYKNGGEFVAAKTDAEIMNGCKFYCDRGRRIMKECAKLKFHFVDIDLDCAPGELKGRAWKLLFNEDKEFEY
jgi:GNAT superfamily N-acetyltransferase